MPTFSSGLFHGISDLIALWTQEGWAAAQKDGMGEISLCKRFAVCYVLLTVRVVSTTLHRFLEVPFLLFIFLTVSYNLPSGKGHQGDKILPGLC